MKQVTTGAGRMGEQPLPVFIDAYVRETAARVGFIPQRAGKRGGAA